LSFRWNYQWHVRYKYKDYNVQMSEELLRDYEAARESPGIIHYLTPTKPWNDAGREFSELFWKYAEGTPYEKELLDKRKENSLK